MPAGVALPAAPLAAFLICEACNSTAVQVRDLVEDLGESARPRMQAAIAAEVQVCPVTVTNQECSAACGRLCDGTPKWSCNATPKVFLSWLQEKAKAAMTGLDLDELLSEPSASAAAQPQPGEHPRQQDAGAAQHAAQSPAAASAQGSGDAQPTGGAAQSSGNGSSSSRSGGGIGGNNDIVTRLKSRTERNRGGPA